MVSRCSLGLLKRANPLLMQANSADCGWLIQFLSRGDTNSLAFGGTGIRGFLRAHGDMHS
jgi:hypothetical protein